MDAFVESREEDLSSANENHDLLQKSNQIQVASDSESENSMITETKSIILHGQDLTNCNWEMDEHTSPTDHILMSNGQSNSPLSKLENPPLDCTSTTNVILQLPTSFSNGVKSSNSTIRRPSPSRKASLTSKPLRSSTPTPRATVTTTTKPMAPIKRSTTPTPRPSVLPAAKSAGRSSTPTPQPSKIPAAKSASRSSIPTQRTTILSASKSTSISRSSTPVQRPSITASAKSASRSSTPTTRPSNPSVKSRGGSPTVKSRPSKSPPEKPVTKTNWKSVPKRTSCSPSRRMVSNGGGSNTLKSGIIVDDDDVNPVLIGTKMVERVVNMRKLAPPKQDHISNHNNKLSVQENSGFGRSLSKKSFDMAMRHLDIRRSMSGNMRAMITKIPASSVYSVRPESTKTRTVNEQQ